MIMHRLERVLDAAEQASKPGYDLFRSSRLRARILGATNLLDHGEVAHAQNPARTALSIIHRHSDLWL
jgi:hypothetical protein